MGRKRKNAKLGSIYCRKGVWYIRFRVTGKDYRESSKSTDQEVALAFLEKRRNEVVEQRLVGSRPRRVTFDQLVKLIEQDYVAKRRRSTKDMLGRVARLRESFGHVPPVDVTYQALKDYEARRRREGASDATIRYELVVFGRMFKLAVQHGLLATKPLLPEIKVSNARKGFVTQEQFGRLLSHLPIDVAPTVAFLYTTGWRTGEVRNLKWSAVNFAEGVVRLEADATKNEEARTFPFAAHEALRGLLEVQCTVVAEMQRALGAVIPWVFPRADGGQLGSFRKEWNRACKSAGIPGRVPHDLRRSAVRNLELAGVPRSVAMKLTGHKTESIYRRYAIVSEADLADAVRKLGRRSSEA